MLDQRIALMDRQTYEKMLEVALDEARLGRAEGGIPIGAAIFTRAGELVSRGHNRRVQQGSAVLHGEMDALERAGRQPASVYRENIMYTTLSPCAMCTGGYNLRQRAALT